MTVKVYEEIHHGGDLAKREVTLTSDDYDTFFNEVVKTCRYAASAQYTNKHVQQAYKDLMATGRCEYGWIDWTIVKE